MNIEPQPQPNHRTSLYGFEIRSIDNRRALPDQRKTYNIKQLWQRNHEILRMTLIGMSEKDIAAQLGITPATVSNTINSELGTKKLSSMREKRDEDIIDVAKEVTKLLPKALDIYDDILNGRETTKLQKETADTLVMDIGGYRAPTKIHSENAHLYLTPEDVEKLKERGIKAARESGMLAE
jgi:DNA-binding CsgD family transcriptional regulator